MTGTIALTNLGNIANALFNSVTANSTAITALSVGGATVNSTAFAGTANNASNLGGVAAASYQLNSTLAANVATMAANSATFANSSVTNTFTIGTAAYFVANGNLGIGTASPTYPLSINRTGSTDCYARWSNGNGGNLIIGTVGSSGESLLYNAANTAMLLATNATERMRITAAGSVGIGTSSPGKLLSINGDVGIAYGSSIVFNNAGAGSYTCDLAISNFWNGTADQLRFQPSGNSNGILTFHTGGAAAERTERMRIDVSGHVGIGTSSPVGRLDVRGEIFNYVGTVGAQVVLQSWGWSNAIARWKPVIEADASFSLYNYDTTGSSPFRSFFSTNGSGSYTQFSNSVRTSIFYDSDDTNSYWDGGFLVLRNNQPTVFFRDTDHNSAMIHCNGSLLYFLRGGNDTTSWAQVNSQWPLILNLTNNDATFGGAISAVGNITAYSSDKRLKENVKEIPNAIEKIKKIRGVTFDWSDRVDVLGFKPKQKYDDVGVIAQEIEEVLPQVVSPAPFDLEYADRDKTSTKSKSGENFKTVQYERLVPLLIQAIKEQQVQIEALQAKITGN